METHIKKNIIWIASYPKSGNTWFRAFLSCLLSDQDALNHINNLTGNGISSLRSLIDKIIGFDSSFLTHEEIDDLKPAIYKYMACQSERTLYIKTHEAFTYTRRQEPVFPPETTIGIIYIIRNPLDMAASIANHYNVSIDIAIQKMNNDNFIFRKTQKKYMDQTAEKLLSWRKHVETWIHNNNSQIHIIKYEDLHNDPYHTFCKALDFLGMSRTSEQILKAIEFSSFDNLQKQERQSGFIEKPGTTDMFFRKGKVGSYVEELTSAQIEKIIAFNKPLMRDFGYI